MSSAVAKAPLQAVLAASAANRGARLQRIDRQQLKRAATRQGLLQISQAIGAGLPERLAARLKDRK